MEGSEGERGEGVREKREGPKEGKEMSKEREKGRRGEWCGAEEVNGNPGKMGCASVNERSSWCQGVGKPRSARKKKARCEQYGTCVVVVVPTITSAPCLSMVASGVSAGSGQPDISGQIPGVCAPALLTGAHGLYLCTGPPNATANQTHDPEYTLTWKQCGIIPKASVN